MIITQLNEAAKAVSESIDAGNALIAAAIALAVGIVIFIRRYITSNK